jgi:ribosomal protein S18 acetylase RimI-like enzyme
MTGESPQARALRLRRLEDVGLNSSQPPAQLLYDGWLLRLSPGKAKRARSVNALHPGTLALEEKIAHCERLYADRGLPTLFRISEVTQAPGLDDCLAMRGYGKFDLTEVREAAIDPALAAGPDVAVPRLEDWSEMVGELRGSPAAHRAAHLARLVALPLAVRPVALLARDAPMATGLAIAEGEYLGIFDVVTRESARRRGCARQVVSALLRWGCEQGARRAYLQVDAGNAPAISLYDRYGFTRAYGYWYRGRQGEQA